MILGNQGDLAGKQGLYHKEFDANVEPASSLYCKIQHLNLFSSHTFA